MRIELFGGDLAILQKWEKILADYEVEIVDAIEPLSEKRVVIADLDTLARVVLAHLKKGEYDPTVSWILLEGAPDVARAEAFLALGVKGYGNSHMLPVHLRSCLETVLEGKVWVYPDFVYRMVSKLAQKGGEHEREEIERFPETLTKREKEIASYILAGKSNREIAHIANITERTVKAHLGKIYEKMGVANRLELALRLKEKVG